MDFARVKRYVVLFVVCLAVVLGVAVVMVLFTSGSGREPARDVTVDLKANVDTPEYYWASVYIAEPLTPEEYKEVAKSIGDEQFRGRFGQVHIFDDEWARDMELPENQHVELSEEASLRWQQHHVMSYVHDAKGYWFDR
jgi:hypothetical protein